VVQPESSPIPISPETERQIASTFPPSDYDAVRDILLGYGIERWHREVERVRYDTLFLAEGDLAKARRLIDIAKSDYRDLLSAEYHRVQNKSVPHEWAMVHAVNRAGS
jgi:hypothetical protein